jgi:uncharacterized protein
MKNKNLVYTLICDDGEEFFYYPYKSLLTNADGQNLYEKNPIGIEKINEMYVYSPKDYPHQTNVNPIHPFFNPGKKLKNPSRIKIQLGLKCNYKCEYCSQASFVPAASRTDENDTDVFMHNLENSIDLSSCTMVELWGGEPLLYWKKIKKLVPFLKEKCDEDIEFTMVTNGSLLTQEKIDFFKKYRFNLAMSHDGPGYHLRGPDPLDNPKKFEFVKQLIEADKKQELGFAFSIVWTKENDDYDQTVKWFRDKFGTDVNINCEGVVEAYDLKTALNDKTGKFDQKYVYDFREKIYNGIVEGKQPLLQVVGIVEKINEWYGSLLYKKDAEFLGQKCGMDQDDELALDLKGNVLTCQNVGLENKHLAGHLDNFDAVRIKSSRHWSWRNECTHCPVLQLCKGSCMFLTGKEFAQTCWNEYAYNLGIMFGAIKLLTGKKVVDIQGDIRRPSWV